MDMNLHYDSLIADVNIAPFPGKPYKERAA